MRTVSAGVGRISRFRGLDGVVEVGIGYGGVGGEDSSADVCP